MSDHTGPSSSESSTNWTLIALASLVTLIVVGAVALFHEPIGGFLGSMFGWVSGFAAAHPLISTVIAVVLTVVTLMALADEKSYRITRRSNLKYMGWIIGVFVVLGIAYGEFTLHMSYFAQNEVISHQKSRIEMLEKVITTNNIAMPTTIPPTTTATN